MIALRRLLPLIALLLLSASGSAAGGPPKPGKKCSVAIPIGAP